ncbi:hypothetical protein HDV57DRAFT_39435 [Trichoderma longibrachiatum]
MRSALRDRLGSVLLLCSLTRARTLSLGFLPAYGVHVRIPSIFDECWLHKCIDGPGPVLSASNQAEPRLTTPCFAAHTWDTQIWQARIGQDELGLTLELSRASNVRCESELLLRPSHHVSQLSSGCGPCMSCLGGCNTAQRASVAGFPSTGQDRPRLHQPHRPARQPPQLRLAEIHKSLDRPWLYESSQGLQVRRKLDEFRAIGEGRRLPGGDGSLVASGSFSLWCRQLPPRQQSAHYIAAI